MLVPARRRPPKRKRDPKKPANKTSKEPSKIVKLRKETSEEKPVVTTISAASPSSASTSAITAASYPPAADASCGSVSNLSESSSTVPTTHVPSNITQQVRDVSHLYVCPIVPYS